MKTLLDPPSSPLIDQQYPHSQGGPLQKEAERRKKTEGKGSIESWKDVS